MAQSSESKSSLANPAIAQKSLEGIFSQLVDKFFDSRFKFQPNTATILGFHQYDSLAPDLCQASIKDEIASLRSLEKQFAGLESSNLAAQSRIDRQLICSQINARLLELEDIRDWEKNPDKYSALAGSMIYDLVCRDFAPMPERLASVISREKKIESILEAGKANLKNPARVYSEIALEQLPGIIDFFQNSLVERFKPVADKKLQAEFQATNNAVISQLKDYKKFLQQDLLPRSKNNFALGADHFARKLLFEEMVDTSLDQLLADGEAELKRLQKEFIKTAAEIDPSRSAREVFSDAARDHTAPEQLVSSVKSVLNQLRTFCLDKNIVTIPSDDRIEVLETPPFMRALTLASLDAPGPFEQKARDAYYYVTLPEPGWKPAQIEEHMHSFSKTDIINTSVHEAFPGHFVQWLWERQAPSKTTRILESDSNVEGWAHYCEQMMIEEGLENGDRNLKLTMLHDALLRCCRYIVSIKLHTLGMTMEEGTSFFIKEGYQEKSNAEREVKRGTADPTYLVYTLGKLQLLALKDDYKRMKGSQFNIKDFHDRILATGAPPVKIIRRILMEGKN